MELLPTQANPFRPGAGAAPPLLAGRDRELAVAGRKLHELSAGRNPSQGILFWGPRGNGKTALLDRIAAMARGRGMRAERLPVAALGSADRLVRELQERARLHDARVTGVQIGGMGTTPRPADPTWNVPALLRAWIEADTSPLVVLLDEAHSMDPAAGRSLLDAAQAAGETSSPFLLVVAGTPGVRARLRDAGTFTERQFERVPIGRLDSGSAIMALSGPARDAGRPMSEEAVNRLAEESGYYPYFLQLLGSAAWEAADEAGEMEIAQAAVERAIAAARAAREFFYADRLNEAERAGIVEALPPLAAAMQNREGATERTLSRHELTAVLSPAIPRLSAPASGWELRDRLSDLGVIWEAAPGRWELGIPSFAEYILRELRD